MSFFKCLTTSMCLMIFIVSIFGLCAAYQLDIFKLWKISTMVGLGSLTMVIYEFTNLKIKMVEETNDTGAKESEPKKTKFINLRG